MSQFPPAKYLFPGIKVTANSKFAFIHVRIYMFYDIQNAYKYSYDTTFLSIILVNVKKFLLVVR